MKTGLKRIAVIAGISWLFGCATDPETPPVLQFMPLSVGAAFSYHSTDTVIGQPNPDFRLAGDSDFTVHVVRDTMDAAGVHWAQFDAPERALGAYAFDSAYYTNVSNGLARTIVSPNLKVVQSTILLFLYPAQRGQFVPDGPEVSATDTVITVPAGTFHCLRYDLVDRPTPGPTIYWSVFVSPGTGVVERILNVEAHLDGQLQVTGRQDRIYRLTAIRW
jgi:hypothetical protein